MEVEIALKRDKINTVTPDVKCREMFPFSGLSTCCLMADTHLLAAGVFSSNYHGSSRLCVCACLQVRFSDGLTLSRARRCQGWSFCADRQGKSCFPVLQGLLDAKNIVSLLQPLPCTLLPLDDQHQTWAPQSVVTAVSEPGSWEIFPKGWVSVNHRPRDPPYTQLRCQRQQQR